MEGLAYLHLCAAYEEEGKECQLPEIKFDWKKPSTWLAGLGVAAFCSSMNVAAPASAIYVNTPGGSALCGRTGPNETFPCVKTYRNGSKLPQPTSTIGNYLRLSEGCDYNYRVGIRNCHVYAPYTSLVRGGPRGVVAFSGNIARRGTAGGPALYDIGASGPAVGRVQSKLKNGFSRRYYYGKIDRLYGSQTKAAVRRFQQSRNILADGVVGPQTQKYL